MANLTVGVMRLERVASKQLLIAPTKVRVRSAGPKGRGVFASSPIRRGECIERSAALLIPKEEADDLLASFLAHYIFRTDQGRSYVIGLGSTSLFNHSASPNAEFSVTRETVSVKATRDIAMGHEITVDYGWTKRELAEAGIQTPS